MLNALIKPLNPEPLPDPLNAPFKALSAPNLKETNALGLLVLLPAAPFYDADSL